MKGERAQLFYEKYLARFLAQYGEAGQIVFDIFCDENPLGLDTSELKVKINYLPNAEDCLLGIQAEKIEGPLSNEKRCEPLIYELVRRSFAPRDFAEGITKIAKLKNIAKRLSKIHHFDLNKPDDEED